MGQYDNPSLMDLFAQQGAQAEQSQIRQIQGATGLAGLMEMMQKRKREEEMLAQGQQLAGQFGGNDPGSQAIKLLLSQTGGVEKVAQFMAEREFKQRDKKDEVIRLQGLFPEEAQQPIQPQQDTGPRGDFAGDQNKILADIAKIANPDERQAAFQAFKQQYAPAQAPAQQRTAGGPRMSREEAQAYAFSSEPELAAIGKANLAFIDKQALQVSGREGKTRQIQIGGEVVTQELTPNGKWSEIGRGPKFNPAGGEGGTPFFDFIGTPGGIVVGNARSGNLKYGSIEGQPVVKSADSPQLQGAIAGAKKSGTDVGELNVNQYKAAQDAPSQITKLDEQIALINKGNITTGFAADIRNDVKRATALLGSKAAKGSVTDTEVLESMMGTDVFGMIQSLGIGAKGMDTPAEREFLLSVMTGKKTLNPDTLKEMANIRRRVAVRAIDRYNDRIDSGELDNFFSSTGIQKKLVQAPKGDGAVSAPAAPTQGKQAAPIPIQDKKTEYNDYLSAVKEAGTNKEIRAKIDARARERGVIK